MRRQGRPATVERALEQVVKAGPVEAMIAAVDAQVVDYEGRLAAAPEVRAAGFHDALGQLARVRAFLSEGGAPAAPDVVAARLHASWDAQAAWVASRGPVLDALRAHVLAHDLDAPLSADEFRPIFDALANDACTHWAMVRHGFAERTLPTPLHTSLVALAKRGFAAALAEVAADLYVGSPERRARVPAAVLERCEPAWRALHDNRPHRMGGLHDGIQSEAAPGPQTRVLLFQIATDYAMQWCWGDSGAWYVFVDAARLAAHDVSQVDAWLECH